MAMIRDTSTARFSPTLAETALAMQHRPARTISLEGYGPARRVLAGIVAVALAIGAALPVRAETDDLATGLAALGALALIAGETEGNPLSGIGLPRAPQEVQVRDRDDGFHGPVSTCRRDIGPPWGKAWGYRARHGCAPAPGHHDRGSHHRGKGH